MMRFEEHAASPDRLGYVLYQPQQMPAGPLPLILFLHGAGERGADLAQVRAVGLPPRLESDLELPAIVVAPQCPEDEWWNLPKVAQLGALLDEVQARFTIDPARVYVTGLSMGGFGTLLLAAEFPQRFAAIAPVCAPLFRDSGLPQRLARIAHLPTWLFHGEADSVVSVKDSEQAAEILRKAGGAPRLTIYPGVDHNSWDAAYAESEFFPWLLNQRR